MDRRKVFLNRRAETIVVSFNDFRDLCIAVNTLPEKERAVFTGGFDLKSGEPTGITTTDLAKALHISIDCVMRLRLNALKRLAKYSLCLQLKNILLQRPANSPPPLEALVFSVEVIDIQDAQAYRICTRALHENHIFTIGDLIMLSEAELLSLRGFGRAVVEDIKKQLAKFNLCLGWRPSYEELSRFKKERSKVETKERLRKTLNFVGG